MAIEFTRNARPTIGIEVELHLVDAVTGELVSASNELLAEMGAGHPNGEHPTAKHELFQSTVEIITGVCDTPAEAHADLRRTLEELIAAGANRNIVPMSSGTHPFAFARDQLISPSSRYEQLVERMQWTARRLLICGMHVHVGVADGERAIAIINELTRHLPTMLALSASSPYFEGDDSGLSSVRSKVFESLPTAGLPPRLAGWSDFEEYMDTLVQTRCIETVREVWWDVRPHPNFGTIEIRMFDVPHTLSEAAALAALAQAIVEWCNRELDAGRELPHPPAEWTVRQNRWIAGRYGMDAELIVEEGPGSVPRRQPVHSLVTDLVEQLTPIACDLGSERELTAVLDILDAGNGAQRQRRVVDSGGTLLDVVRLVTDELRDDRPTR